MAHQIIQQPNGKFALYSTIVDAFLSTDLTKEELIKEETDYAIEEAKSSVARHLDSVFSQIEAGTWGRRVTSYEDALRNHNQRLLESCEDQLEADPLLKEGENRWTVAQHEYYMAKKQWSEETRRVHRDIFKGVIYFDKEEDAFSYTE